VGAGDIARCDRTTDEATAAILDTISGTVFTIGDNVLGTSSQPPDFTNCYAPSTTWGRHKARTRPAPGHTETWSPGDATYYHYWGAAAGDSGKGYYSYNLGAWHIVVLNSDGNVSTTAPGSPQEQWLQADLAANTQQCILAIWHFPRFSSSGTAGRPEVKPFWDDLYAAGAALVLNAHYELYERFAPQSPAGVLDPQRGIRQFTVGTGGMGTSSVTAVQPNSEVRRSGVPGVLRLTLGDGTYSWQFIPVAGQTFTDAGSGGCVTRAPSVYAGPDLTTHPGDMLSLTASFTDGGANAAPWTYTITWGDGTSTSGTTASSAPPITAGHVYAAVGLDTVRATVTNNQGLSGSDAAVVQVIATGSAVFVGAGDIADCSLNGDSFTANLLDTIPGTVFVAGDNAYPDGSSTDYANCYAPTWGRQKARTRPIPGNHEYSTAGAAGYFGYFGAAAGDPSKGYYSYDLGDWHIIALNSNVGHAAGSLQEQWLRADLAASTKRCTLAYLHHPLFSSGSLADSSTRILWQDLYSAGAEIVVAGHEHNYQRFAPQTAKGVADPNSGIREFIVGTGGEGRFGVGAPRPNTEVQNDATFGVLKLTLYATGYNWKFIPIAGQTFTDLGSGSCHDAQGAVNHSPTAAAGGPYAGAEGAAVSFDGSTSTDPDGDALTYAWSFGDGSSGTGVRPSHTYADNGSYTVTLTVTDSHGAASGPATTTTAISNAAPVVSTAAAQTATAGSPFTLSATFSDVGGGSDTPWAYAIDWGDGSSQTTGSVSTEAPPITATHTYPAAGTDNLRLTVTDKDGGTGSATVTVTVSGVNHPPTAGPGGPYAGTEAAAVSFDGSGSSDPDGDALTYAWNFGDGGTGTGVRPIHTYVTSGSYTVTLTVTDSRGAASGPAATTATIANAAPVVDVGPTQTATAGSPFTLSASFHDAGVNDAPWAYAISWEDGTPQATGSTSSQSSPITAPHTYSAAGSYTAQVTVTDRYGASGLGGTSVTVSVAPATQVLVGAGDIARCDRTNDELTAAIMDTIAGTVFTIGDNVVGSSTQPPDFTNCYAPSTTWGRHKARTRPVPGHTETWSPGDATYYQYFGAAAGDSGKGYYSYDLGAWHIIVLNTGGNTSTMAAGSPQELWLRADLAANTRQCTLAIWHHPRFSSAGTALRPEVQPFWDDLYAAGAELVLNAHYELYERFAPQTPAGVLDLQRGIRQFTVGTGGIGTTSISAVQPNSEVRNPSVFGVLKLTLSDTGYTWRFIPVVGSTFTDSGTGSCH